MFRKIIYFTDFSASEYSDIGLMSLANRKIAQMRTVSFEALNTHAYCVVVRDQESLKHL